MRRDIVWPRKTREMHNHHFNSTIWNEFTFRRDDVVIATYAKSGTTWVQHIVGQLIFEGREDVSVAELSPWLDLRVPAKDIKLGLLEAQTHRRIIKTHLPVDALRFAPGAKYIYVGRDGRDVVWSLHNHHSGANDLWYRMLNDTPGLVGPPICRPTDDIRRYFLDWLERDGWPFWPFWESVASWWAIRDLPNVLPLHFDDLKKDLPGEIRRIATFLEIDLAPGVFASVVEHAGFDWMKAHAAQAAPLGGAFLEGGARQFINKGVNGRWRDVLTADDCRRYERVAIERLGPDCAGWLAGGKAPVPLTAAA